MEVSFPVEASSRRHDALAPRVVDELVVNWHVTEACNYRCRYCYSQWEREAHRLDVIRDEAASLDLVDALWQYFRAENDGNPLRAQLQWSNLSAQPGWREPMLFPRQIARVARHAKSRGMRVSMITNGSLLGRDAGVLSDLRRLARHAWVEHRFDVGFRQSRDRRADRKGNALSMAQLVALVADVRAAIPVSR